MPLDLGGGVVSRLLLVVWLRCVVEVPRRRALRRCLEALVASSSSLYHWSSPDLARSRTRPSRGNDSAKAGPPRRSCHSTHSTHAKFTLNMKEPISEYLVEPRRKQAR